MNEISAAELKIQRANNTELLVIDVREPWEFEEENIGATNIPLHSLPEQLLQLSAYKNTEFVVHCKSGSRSKQAYKFLTKNGFNKVINLTGGIEAYLA